MWLNVALNTIILTEGTIQKKWIIQRYRQKYAHKTQDENKSNTQLNAENLWEEQNEPHKKSRVNPGTRDGYAAKILHAANMSFINSTNSDILSYFDSIERHID